MHFSQKSLNLVEMLKKKKKRKKFSQNVFR